MERIMEIANVATYVVLAIVAVGAFKAIVGDITYHEFVATNQWIVGGLAIGRGIGARGRVLTSSVQHGRHD